MKGLLLFFMVIAIGCNSQTSKNTIEKYAVPLIDSFFQTIKNNESTMALDRLLKTNPNISMEDSATQYLIKNFILINQAVGDYVGYRQLKKKFLKDDIGIYSYLVKYEKKFFRFVFLFYNNGNSTRLYKFLYDDNLEVELEESLKYYLN